MELKLTISGLCAFVTDKQWVADPSQQGVSTTREAWALLISHRGHAEAHHPGPHAVRPHAPGLLVEYRHLGVGTSDPDRLFDDPEGRHWAWWDLADTRVQLRHANAQRVELVTGQRPDEPCVRQDEHWHDVESLGDMAKAYPTAALKPGWNLMPPGTLPIVTQILLRDGRVRALPPGPWARRHRWVFDSGYDRAMSEVLEYRRSSVAASMTLVLTPYSEAGTRRTVVLNDDKQAGVIPVAISNLTPEVRPVVSKHLELYLDLLTDAHDVPDFRDCQQEELDVTFPDACPQMLVREMP